MAGFSKTNIKKHLAIPMTSLLEKKNIEELKSFSNLDDDEIETLKYFLKDVFNTVDNIKTYSSNNQQKNDIDFINLYESLEKKIQEKGEKFEIIIEKIKKKINTETKLEIDYDVLEKKIKENFGESEKSQKSKSRTSKKSEMTSKSKSKSRTSKKFTNNFSMKRGNNSIYQNGGVISETVVLSVFMVIAALIIQNILKILSSSNNRNREIIMDYMINMCLFLKRMFSRYMEYLRPSRVVEQQQENSQYAECPVCMVNIHDLHNCRACSICHHKWHAICFPGTQRMELIKCPMCRSTNTEVCIDTFDYFLNPAPQPIAPAPQPIAPAPQPIVTAPQPIATRRPSTVKDFFVELMRALLCFPDVDSIQNQATVTIPVIRRNSSGGKYKTRKRKRNSLK
jgi:hypothetical protein